MDTSVTIALLIGIIVGLVMALWLVVLILRAVGSGHGHYH